MIRSVRAGAGRSVKGVGRGTKAGARIAARSGHASARMAARGSRASARRFRIFTHSGGAGESGLARLIELNAVHTAGDTALAMSLVGTIFSIPTGEARGQVALFLLVTMAPFTVLAPLIGPLLDRYRHGRRWAIGTTMATRAFLCWVLADAVVTKSLWLFPAALGCLVASRAYNVTRASAVPRLLPHGVSLVAANSRQSLAGVAGMLLGGAIAGAAIRIGPDWSLRAAFVIYVVGTVLAILLPARVDSSLGEQDIEQTDEGRASSLWTGLRTRPREGSVRRFRHRVEALPWRVLFAWWCTAGTRLLAGFLVLFLAFLMRDHPIKGLSGTLVLGLVVAAAASGNTLGSVVGTRFNRRAPETIAATALLVATVAAVTAAVFYSAWTLVVLGLVAGLSGQLANLSFDALVQSDIGETVRTSVFAWAETLLQIAWVIGGGLGIALPLIPQLGFGIIAGLLVGTFLMAIRSRIARRRRKATVARPLHA
ncbi:MAG: MFS transporter [Phycicoccus sp.]|nr:MFS transporter [Phycicoccus sp.]NMM34810.1 MFS transporter [Phycicoccus sp.]